MSDVLLVQNTRVEGSGYLGELLTKDGFDITSVNAKHESLPENNFSLVVVLGAPESANDDLPYLQAEQQLIKNNVEKNIPVLGICLGSQLIAKTFGAKVYSGPRNEIGFYNDLEISNESILFSGFKNPCSFIHSSECCLLKYLAPESPQIVTTNWSGLIVFACLRAVAM